MGKSEKKSVIKALVLEKKGVAVTPKFKLQMYLIDICMCSYPAPPGLALGCS